MTAIIGWTREEALTAASEWIKQKLPLSLLKNLLELETESPHVAQTRIAGFLDTPSETAETSDISVEAEEIWRTFGRQEDSSIILTGMELDNFLLFSHTDVTFKPNRARPVVVIEGKNGYGKSSIIRAIRFVLASEMEPNDIAHFVHASVPGNQAEAKVILRFHSEENGDFDIRRIQQYRKQGGTWVPIGESDVIVNIKPAPLRGEEAREWIATRFPKELLSFFVFDAESSLINELSGQKGTELPPVQNAVESALAIRPLRWLEEQCSLSSHALGSRASKLQKDIRSEKRRRIDQAGQIDQIEAELEELDLKVIELQGQKESAQMEVDRYKDRADPDMQKRRESLIQEKERARARVEAAEQQKIHVLSESLPLALLGCAASLPTSLIDDKSPDWRRGADDITDMIARIISEAKFAWVKNPPSTKEISRSLREAAGLPQPEDRNKALKRRESAQKIAEASSRGFTELRQWLNSDELSTWKERLQEIEQNLRDTSIPEETKEWVDKYVEARQTLDRIESELAETQKRKEDLVSQKSGYSEESVEGLDGSGSTDVLIARLKAQKELVDKAIFTLRTIAGEMLKNRIELLETHASQMLVRTAHKHDILTRIHIDPKTYRYRVLKMDGNPAPVGRSTGERNLLSLCLVHAIRQASGVSIPLVVEAPLRVLDPIHRDSVLRELLSQYQGQLLLLVTPEEIPAAHDSQFKDRVNHRFKLVRRGDKEVSDIEDGGEVAI